MTEKQMDRALEIGQGLLYVLLGLLLVGLLNLAIDGRLW